MSIFLKRRSAAKAKPKPKKAKPSCAPAKKKRSTKLRKVRTSKRTCKPATNHKPVVKKTAAKKTAAKKTAAKKPVAKKPAATKATVKTPAAKTPLAPSTSPASPVAQQQPAADAPRPSSPNAEPTGIDLSEGPGYDSPLPVFEGTFGRKEAERLLWRAGFGPRPGDIERFVQQGLVRSVLELTRPVGPDPLSGPATNLALAPIDIYGDDVLWWMDRMVRTDQPLVERMTLIWHDWFATRLTVVAYQHLMLRQNTTIRQLALGSFEDLLFAITQDPAMLLFLDGVRNIKGAINENYARELMELFTLGAERGAYTEQDVREMARALSGWRIDDGHGTKPAEYVWVPNDHDDGVKTIFGQSGRFDWRDALRLCLNHAMHPSFVVRKLWASFIPTPPSPADEAALATLYVRQGRAIRPLLEAILLHPELHTGPSLVKSPVVHAVGLLRQAGKPLQSKGFISLTAAMGQTLFDPPSVAGWDDDRWLDTSDTYGRWGTARQVALPDAIQGAPAAAYSSDESPEAAVETAHRYWNRPSLSDGTSAQLLDFARRCLPSTLIGLDRSKQRAQRQNALRQLIGASPDLMVS